jgi:predicted unusual protein kinase regulating ubiquinone biosynthesis (AarF/ABC1/UbiB family)
VSHAHYSLQATLDELTKLQDAVVPFDTTVAVQQIERELGGPLGQFFTSISEEPVAAASLAQVRQGNNICVAWASLSFQK